MENNLGPLYQALRSLADNWERPIWSVYALFNSTRSEVYFGISMDPAERLTKDHARGKTKALSHWDFANDILSIQIIGTGLSGSSASSLSHSYEDIWFHGNYRSIQTRGK